MNEETKEPISNNKIMVRYAIHILLTLVMAVGVAWFSHEIVLEKAWDKQYLLFAGAILAVIFLCCLAEKKKIYLTVRSTAVLLACFMVSALLLLLSDYYVNLPIWLIGGIVAAALVNRNIGMLYLYYFVYHAIFLDGIVMLGLVFHFVVATLISFLIPKMKSFLGMFYMMAFTACAVIAGSVIHNKMAIDTSMMLDTFYILCTYLSCILLTMLLVKWTGGYWSMEKPEEEPVQNDYAYLDLLAQETAVQDAAIAAITRKAAEEKKAEEQAAATEIVAETVAETVVETVVATVAETVSMEESQTETSATEDAVPETVVAETVVTEDVVEPVEEIDYTPYCNEKAELLMELRGKNKSAYAQSVLVGKLASETAKSIGLNVELTKAAGLYKLIGKLKENSNEYSSTEVAKEHNFPEPLIYLLDQLNHNIIEQKEAALLLITDGVISYYSVVRNVQKSSISVEKIVDNIVSKKIFQGEFNESGLSVQECFLLREKLINLLQSQDKKQAAK